LVLVLFVLMLVDPDDLPEFHTARPVQRTVGLLLGVVLLLEVGAAILNRTVIRSGVGTAPVSAEGNVQAVGRVLYTDYLLAFEVISLVLTVGVIGAIVLALPERLGERVGTRRGTISLSHTRGTDAGLALPSGPAGEAPIYGAEASRQVEEASRELIRVRDPDSYTTVGGRR